MFKLIVAGDLHLTSKASKALRIDHGLEELFRAADFSIANLESPLVGDRANAMPKTGPTLSGCAYQMMHLVTKINLRAVTLANNHIMDYGARGLNETLAQLAKAKILSVGAGSNVENAQQPLRIETQSGAIAILNVAEQEWGAANSNKPGFAALKLPSLIQRILHERTKAKWIICICHGGNEFYKLPSPHQRDLSRVMIDVGAAAVVWHHSHVISGFERYRRQPIFYGLGNLMFDNFPDDGTSFGLVPTLGFEDNKSEPHIALNFTRYDTIERVLRLANNTEQQLNERELQNSSSIIDDDTALEKKWKAFCDQKADEYLGYLSWINSIPFNTLRRALLKLGLHKATKGKKHAMYLLNLIRADAHREVLTEILSRKLSSDSNS